MVGSACDADYKTEDLLADGSWDHGNYYILGGSGRVMNPGATVSILAGITARAAAASVTVLLG